MILGERGARAAVVSLAVALSACSGGSSGGTPSPSSLTSTPGASAATSVPVTPSVSSGTTGFSPSASIVVPVLPEAAQHPTREGAAAFLPYFFAVYDYSFDVLDSRLLRRISEASCGFCSSTADAADVGRQQGLTYSGGRNKITFAVAAPGTPTTGLVVNALIEYTAGVTTAPDGTVRESFAASPPHRVDARVRWDGHQWKAAGVVILKPSAS